MRFTQRWASRGGRRCAPGCWHRCTPTMRSRQRAINERRWRVEHMELALMSARFPRVALEQRLSATTPGAHFEGALSDLGTLRAALALLVEDPPFALGRSVLACRALPHERDVMERGWALADM